MESRVGYALRDLTYGAMHSPILSKGQISGAVMIAPESRDYRKILNSTLIRC